MLCRFRGPLPRQPQWWRFVADTCDLSLDTCHMSLLEFFSPEFSHIEGQAWGMTKKGQHYLHQKIWKTIHANYDLFFSIQLVSLPSTNTAPHGRCVAKAAMRAGRKLREAGWDAVQQRSVGDSVPNKTSHGCYEPVTSLFYCSVDDRSQCLNGLVSGTISRKTMVFPYEIYGSANFPLNQSIVLKDLKFSDCPRCF